MTAFILYLRCENCGNKWKRQVEEGKLVDGHRFTSKGVSISEKYSRGGERVECPVCKIKERVRIRKREPAK